MDLTFQNKNMSTHTRGGGALDGNVGKIESISLVLISLCRLIKRYIHILYYDFYYEQSRVWTRSTPKWFRCAASFSLGCEHRRGVVILHMFVIKRGFSSFKRITSSTFSMLKTYDTPPAFLQPAD